ncbi:hypothetical protein EAH89_28245 [Roseomonas nepalensis]|uniref:Uncharacterized protein n=1 Tax=Muricoccus nepalensis TaxID=1854500 RepID=A0A502EZC5_9PROT|nr:hypothetical protein EAH89_28245 [Roseomonas nepalensis]
MSRLDIQRAAEPQLTADVRMYETAANGRMGPALPGWGCQAVISKTSPQQGWDALPLLRDRPLCPGETRQLGFVFLSDPEATEALRQAGRFYLWEGRFVGEAVVVF